MKSAFLAGVIASVVCMLVAAPVTRAQGVGASGTINGTAVDPTGAVVPKVLVVAVEADRGIVHSTETDTTGFYRLTGLPPTTYDITAYQPMLYAAESFSHVEDVIGTFMESCDDESIARLGHTAAFS